MHLLPESDKTTTMLAVSLSRHYPKNDNATDTASGVAVATTRGGVYYYPLSCRFTSVLVYGVGCSKARTALRHRTEQGHAQRGVQ